jgi:methyl coenzyme M reductase subunit C-like uncharacterized protein (methanogenesis marker protein 7)
LKTEILYQRNNNVEGSIELVLSPYERPEVIGLFIMLGLEHQKVEMDYDENRKKLDKIRFFFSLSDVRNIENRMMAREKILIPYTEILAWNVEWKNFLEIGNSRIKGNATQ